jgi:hypothetical protein
MLADRRAERMKVEVSTVSITTCPAALAPITRPATPARQIMSTFVTMQTTRRPKAARPYLRFRRFRTPVRAMAIPVPKNQTLKTALEESRNVVAIWSTPRARIAKENKKYKIFTALPYSVKYLPVLAQ